jgi:hypothetical protein
LAKAVHDLLKPPKYELSAKTTNKTDDGWRFETSAASAKGKLTGALKINLANEYGDFEGHMNTDNSIAELKASNLKLNKDFSANVLVNNGSGNPNTAELEVHYSPPDLVVGSLKASYRADENVGLVTANGAIGTQGLSVAGMAELIVDQSGAESAYHLRDYNTGIQYAGSGFVAALSSKLGKEKGGGFSGGNMEDVQLSYWHEVSKNHQVAAQFDINSDSSIQLTAGFDYKLAPNSSFRAIANTKGAIHTRLTHVLSDPRVKLGFSNEFNAKGHVFEVQNFGISAEFGKF